MAFNLTHIPTRTQRPRQHGLTMVMDKGLGQLVIKDFLELCADYVDVLKLGFGTACVTPNLKEKIALYKQYNLMVYFGGTMFEAFVLRGMFDEYVSLCQEFDIRHFEVSDGSITLDLREKCRYIEKLAKIGTVFSEVGSKDADDIMPPYKWIECMRAELDAGASYVIAEARESGTVGVYRSTGEVRQGLVQEILTQIPAEKIIWEAPRKEQQLFFLKLLGCNVNLGNLSFAEVIALETMRIGLRADTFFLYMDKPKS